MLIQEQFLKRTEIEAKTSLARSTIYARMKEGTFPRPISIGGNSVRWKLTDIVAWMDSCEAKGEVLK
jgi:prophage regulatory protein